MENRHQSEPKSELSSETEVSKYDENILKCVRNIELTDQDTMICTYPRSGTTWMQQIVSLIINAEDVDEASRRSILDRFFHLEFGLIGDKCGAECLIGVPPPRLIKSHLNEWILNKHVVLSKVKTIVVIRNPLDTLVSVYHFCKSHIALKFDGDWNEFFELFREKRLLPNDVIDWIAGWWRQRHLDNVLFVRYEDMKADLKAVIKRLAEFLKKDDLSDDVVDRICELSSVEAMRRNPATNYENFKCFDWNTMDELKAKQKVGEDINYEEIKKKRLKKMLGDNLFIRRGIVGEWKSYFSEEQLEFLKERCDPLKSEGLDLLHDVLGQTSDRDGSD